jgi:hypothetical protein
MKAQGPTESVTVYGYQTRYQSRNLKNNCFSRRKSPKLASCAFAAEEFAFSGVRLKLTCLER